MSRFQNLVNKSPPVTLSNQLEMDGGRPLIVLLEFEEDHDEPPVDSRVEKRFHHRRSINEESLQSKWYAVTGECVEDGDCVQTDWLPEQREVVRNCTPADVPDEFIELIHRDDLDLGPYSEVETEWFSSVWNIQLALRDEENADDIEDEILNAIFSLTGGSPSVGALDADMIESNQSQTQRDRRSELLQLVEKFNEETGELLEEDQLVTTMAGKGYDKSQVEKSIQKLKRKGELVEKEEEKYRVV
jgi:hypothetical protein